MLSNESRKPGLLAGRVALVTGATGGIGAAVARRFAAEGALVLLHGRDLATGKELARALGGRFLYADLLEDDAPERLVQAVDDHGRLDVLVNNAGHEIHKSIAELTRADLDHVFRVNFTAPVRLLALCLPLLRRSLAPSVINVTSIHESVPVASNAAYASAKAALAMFSRTAAIELGPEGIRVNTLAPGAIVTEMNRELIAEVGEDRFKTWIPLGRIGTVDEVADAALFLAGDASRYMTGSTLTLDGGYANHLVRYGKKEGDSHG